MAEYPLLIFPQPGRAERAKRTGGGRPARIPNSQRQAQRLEPQFRRLQQAMERRRLALQENALGLQPEQVLVFETIGPIQNFINVVRKIDGLEWLGEVETDDIPADHGFEDTKDPQKPLKGHIFLMMTDQRALREVQSLFDKWQQNPDRPFPRGLAPLKQAFAHLYIIRPWDAEDRIRNTGLLEDWQARVEYGQEVVPFEAELWLRGNPSRRQLAEAYLQDVIKNLGGEVVQRCIIPEIAYHGLLGRIPVERVTEIVDRREVRLLRCEDLMFLRPVGQCAVRIPDDSSEAESMEEARAAADLPDGEPVVALLEEGGIEAFLRREVLPYAPDAWYDPAGVKIGYEISFNRYFYKPKPLRSLDEIRADLLAVEQEAEGVLKEILGGGH